MVMLRAIGVASAAICLCAAGADHALAATPTAATPPTLTVSGAGTATGVPDELGLSLSVETQAASVSAALDPANTAMSKVTEALTAEGAAPADLQTSGLSVQAQYDQHNKITGYTVGESLTAELRDLKRAGQAITDAINAGGNAIRVDNVALDLTDQEAKLTAEARAHAIADAGTRAEQYATAAGLKLGQVLTINETGAADPPEPVIPGALFSARSSVPISAGTQQVTASVLVTYQLTSP
jgi:uncharacterized protein YggE